MCGIVGYIGDRDITSILLVGLQRLSYRGYDSSGIGILSDGELSTWKKSGKLVELETMIDGLSIQGNIGIGHTRWATHGIPNDINSHPHVNQSKKLAIVHNGIIENFSSIKSRLSKQGFLFRSQTDTEVIAHLIEYYMANASLETAVENALLEIQGSFALAVIAESEPDKIIAARRSSPLIIGVGDNENFISSDINPILSHTKKVVYMNDNELAVITRDHIQLKLISGPEIPLKTHQINWNQEASEKGGYDHFMLKEIHSQPHVVRTILSKYIKGKNQIQFKDLHRDGIDLKLINRFIIQACGTSWHSGLIGKYLIEQYAHVLTEVDISSEFRYRQMISQGNDVVMGLSQSGETADTLACIREAKSKFYKVLSFVNVKGSSIDRESDGVIYSHAGQEVGVASTKNYIAQIVTIYLFAIHLAHIKGKLSTDELVNKIDQLNKIPEYMDSILSKADELEAMAEKYYLSREFLFIGRGLNYPTALEGALKLKEISYIHATGYAAGELKHGPIALIDAKLPIVCISPQTSTYEKMLSNIQEVKARKGKTIIIATEGDKEIKNYANDLFYIPKAPEELTPLLACIPLQLLSYYIAVKLDCDVAQPRNLAKSVTVE